MFSNFYQNLPSQPGVYFFINKKGATLYIGKALNLRNRVKNYFVKKGGDPRVNKFINQVKRVDYIVTSSEIESLLLEARLIKEHQPKYNVRLKDDKRYLYVGITKEKWPRVWLLRQPEKEQQNLLDWFGPFPSASSLKEILRLLRRIFPYCSCKRRISKPCFYYYLKLCPAPHLSEKVHLAGVLPHTSEVRENYKKTIKNIRLFLNGKIDFLVKDLTKQMQETAKQEKFEQAAKLKKQIQMMQNLLGKFKKTADETEAQKSLNSLRKILVRYSGIDPTVIHRLEAYDIANLGKKIIVGSMVAFLNGEPDTSLYRQFKIITSRQDDPASLRQIISRRFSHQEWLYPQVILVDGGKAQVSAAFAALKEKKLLGKIALLGLAKPPKTPPNSLNSLTDTILIPLTDKDKICGYKLLNYSSSNSALKLLQHARDESHRFAQRYFHKLQKKSLTKS